MFVGLGWCVTATELNLTWIRVVVGHHRVHVEAWKRVVVVMVMVVEGEKMSDGFSGELATLHDEIEIKHEFATFACGFT
ncbi:hypothetical protein DsansV1_C35g0231111 [Dioscorea sansibarensis]